MLMTLLADCRDNRDTIAGLGLAGVSSPRCGPTLRTVTRGERVTINGDGLAGLPGNGETGGGDGLLTA
jgi:hypothetical protein